jgi:hypothetical protein
MASRARWTLTANPVPKSGFPLDRYQRHSSAADLLLFIGASLTVLFFLTSLLVLFVALTR